MPFANTQKSTIIIYKIYIYVRVYVQVGLPLLNRIITQFMKSPI